MAGKRYRKESPHGSGIRKKIPLWKEKRNGTSKVKLLKT
jgi:hypothetical protein